MIGYLARRRVWIDGDVRIAFEERTRTNGSRDVTADLVDYPQYLKGFEAPAALEQGEEWGKNQSRARSFRSSCRIRWRVSKLGEAQSQAVADMSPGTWENGGQPFWYRLNNGNELQLLYPNERVGYICEFHQEIGPERFEQFRKSLSDEFGAPNVRGLRTGWNNGKIKFTYTVNDGEDVGRPFMLVCTQDADYFQEEQQQDATPPEHYNTAPSGYSLFLLQDLVRPRN